MSLTLFERSTLSQQSLDKLKSKYYKTNCASNYALQALTSIINDYPDEALPARYFRSLVYRNQGKSDIAISELLAIINEEPNCIDAVARLADLYIDKNLITAGLKKFDELVVTNPEDNTYIFYRGVIYFNSGNHDSCKQDLEVIFNDSSNTDDGLFAKALCLQVRMHFLAEEYTEALEYIQKFYACPITAASGFADEHQLCSYMYGKIRFILLVKEDADNDFRFIPSQQADSLFLKSEILKHQAKAENRYNQLIGVDEEYRAYMAYKAGDAFDVPSLSTIAKWSFLTEGEARANVRGVWHKLPFAVHKHHGVNPVVLSRVRKLHCGIDAPIYSIFDVKQEHDDFSKLQSLDEEQPNKKVRL